MYFGSDNSSPAHPSILNALIAANDGYTSGYGNEELRNDIPTKTMICTEKASLNAYQHRVIAQGNHG